MPKGVTTVELADATIATPLRLDLVAPADLNRLFDDRAILVNAKERWPIMFVNNLLCRS